MRPTAEWEEFTSYGADAACEIVIVPDLWAWDLWSAFVAHLERHDLTPRILVTDKDPENVRRAFPVNVTASLWLESGYKVEIGDSVDKLASHGLLLRCQALFAGAEGLTPELKRALLSACTAPHAIRSVNTLASVADRDRRTVSTAWTRFVGPSPAIRLKPLLDLVLLLRAIHLRHHRLRWPQVTRRLDVSMDILRERAAARLGKSLHDLTIEDAGRIVKRLEGLLEGDEAAWPLAEEKG